VTAINNAVADLGKSTRGVPQAILLVNEGYSDAPDAVAAAVAAANAKGIKVFAITFFALRTSFRFLLLFCFCFCSCRMNSPSLLILQS
jgi:hypothetical protein